MFQDYLKDEEIKLMFAFTAVALFIIPLLLAGFVSPAEFGQQVSWGQYFNDPSRMIGRFWKQSDGVWSGLLNVMTKTTTEDSEGDGGILETCSTY